MDPNSFGCQKWKALHVDKERPPAVRIWLLLIVHSSKTMHFHLRHMERTLERLLQIQAAMEELAVALDQAEGVRDAWEPVGDLFIDSLQDHIDATKVRRTTLPSTHTHVSTAQIADLNPQECIWSYWSHLTVANVQLIVIFTLCRLYYHQNGSIRTNIHLSITTRKPLTHTQKLTQWECDSAETTRLIMFTNVVSTFVMKTLGTIDGTKIYAVSWCYVPPWFNTMEAKLEPPAADN